MVTQSPADTFSYPPPVPDGGEPITASDGIAEQNRAIYERMTAAETELAEWRRGARRIYWRNRWAHPTFGHTFVDDVSLPRARARKRSLGATLTRVTIKPKGAK